jgi:hypothetical protein
MTAITLSNGKTVNLTAAENDHLTDTLRSRQNGETVYFCDEGRFCSSCAPNRFIGTQAKAVEMLHDWAYGTWERDERGIYGSLEAVKAKLLDEFLAAAQVIEAVDGLRRAGDFNPAVE